MNGNQTAVLLLIMIESRKEKGIAQPMIGIKNNCYYDMIEVLRLEMITATCFNRFKWIAELIKEKKPQKLCDWRRRVMFNAWLTT